MVQNLPKGALFTQYFPDIERMPFSDLAVCSILNVNESKFISGIKSGLIERSVLINYRFDQNFSFIGLFDIFEYLLRKKFFFLVYGKSPEVDELVRGLVDEIAHIIDIHVSSNNRPLSLETVKENLIHLCDDHQETWRKYWLRNGERYSVDECAKLTLVTWVSLFELSMATIGGNPPVSP